MAMSDMGLDRERTLQVNISTHTQVVEIIIELICRFKLKRPKNVHRKFKMSDQSCRLCRMEICHQINVAPHSACFYRVCACASHFSSTVIILVCSVCCICLPSSQLQMIVQLLCMCAASTGACAPTFLQFPTHKFFFSNLQLVPLYCLTKEKKEEIMCAYTLFDSSGQIFSEVPGIFHCFFLFQRHTPSSIMSYTTSLGRKMKLGKK